MSEEFSSYLRQVRAVKRNESNQLLKYILKFTDGNHRWKGSLEKLIYLLAMFRERLGDECNTLGNYKKEYIFEAEIKKIRANLGVRGIKVFINRDFGEMSITIDKRLDDDFSGYYFSEEYMGQFF